MNVDAGRFDDVIRRFYEAAAVPELWPSALNVLAAATGSAGAALIPFPNDAPIPCSDSLGELVDDFIREGWAPRNTRSLRGAVIMRRDPTASMRLHADHDLLSTDEIRRDEFYQDFLLRRGFQWFVGSSLADLEGRHVFIDFERRSAAEPYSRDEVAAMQSLLPHLQVAGKLALRVGLAASQTAVTSLGALGCAAALLDGAGRVVSANKALEALFESRFRLVYGSIVALDREVNTKISELISAALGQRHPAPVALRFPGCCLPAPRGNIARDGSRQRCVRLRQAHPHDEGLERRRQPQRRHHPTSVLAHSHGGETGAKDIQWGKPG